MTVNLRMALVETDPGTGKRVRGHSPDKKTIERRAQLVALPRIAQIEFAYAASSSRIQSLGFDVLARLRFKGREDFLGMIGADVDEGLELAAYVIVHDVGTDEAQRRKRARPRRHQ